jgi:H+/Cl- antiporter ClcA/CBS domain-containing protein
MSSTHSTRAQSERVIPHFRLVRISLLAALIGLMSGIAAQVLHAMIELVTNAAFFGRISTEAASPLESPFGPFIILVPAIGGLIIGAMAKYGSPLVRGHGIPEAMQAVLQKRSRIPPKVALLKPISAAVSIGSGQPFGAEGPVIQTGAALGSILGQALRTTAAERKVLLACGAAGGLAAVFGTPVAAIIFTIELLLFEFRARSFIPLAITSVIATEVHHLISGGALLFPVDQIDFGGPVNLIAFLVLGVGSGLVAALLTGLLYRIEDFYHRLPVNTYLWPALGGLFVGLVGYVVPRLGFSGLDVFGPGYDMIGGALRGEFVLGFLLVLLVAKAAVWLVALGSGTSGGTLAPVFLIGAAFGGVFGLVVKALVPGFDAAPQAFAMAGMAAVFGSGTRATFASVVFAFEMTQNYESILPVLFASVVADVVVNRLTTTSLLTEQLRRSGVLVHHEYEADPLDMVPIGQVMTRDVVTIADTMQVGAIIDQINAQDPRLTRHQALVIIDAEERLRGIVTRGDLMKALRAGQTGITALEAGSDEPIVAYSHESVRQGLVRMLNHDIGRLPVVQVDDPTRVVGYLSRSNVMAGYMPRLQDEFEQEAGWLPPMPRFIPTGWRDGRG